MRIHQKLVSQLTKLIGNYIDANHGGCEVYPAPFAVFLNADNKTYVEPDISVICDNDKLDERGCNGAPDWVIEIVSPSTERMDYGIKLFKYRSAGVREYWIVDTDSKSAQVFLLDDGRYAAKDFGTVGDKLKVNVLDDCFIDLTEVFAG